ncbi:MAG: CBS domain-containing protein [Candidatus Aenigmarchaeota archaeon]|nr:CBS domain-containing protein [Candidatus Aenigmarchaeota archaeon]
MHKIGKLPAEKLMRKRFPKIKINDKISKVIKTLLKTDTSVVPVFEGRKFIGEIHELDMLKIVVDTKEIPEEEIITLGFGLDMGYFAKTARDIVRRHEISISSKTKIKEASFIMLKEGVKSLPVMKNKRLVGILTERDILKRVMKKGLEK